MNKEIYILTPIRNEYFIEMQENNICSNFSCLEKKSIRSEPDLRLITSYYMYKQFLFLSIKSNTNTSYCTVHEISPDSIHPKTYRRDFQLAK